MATKNKPGKNKNSRMTVKSMGSNYINWICTFSKPPNQKDIADKMLRLQKYANEAFSRKKNSKFYTLSFGWTKISVTPIQYYFKAILRRSRVDPPTEGTKPPPTPPTPGPLG